MPYKSINGHHGCRQSGLQFCQWRPECIQPQRLFLLQHLQPGQIGIKRNGSGKRFCSHLRKKKSIESALRKAKLELASSDVLSHPFCWAAFISSGKADQVIFAKASALLPLMAVSFLLLGGMVFLTARRNRIH
jgi:hypothetical protein